MKSFVKQGMRVCGAVVCATAALFVCGTDVVAQDGGSARLSGVVFDSTSMEVLVGARVAVFGTNAAGETDENGRFILTGISAGSYWVSFYHTRLQSLGVSPPSRQVTFGDGERVSVELAVPSEETLLLGWCLAEHPAPGFAAIAGIVTDSLTGVAMPRAIVTAEALSRASGIQPVEVRTDDSGYFRMCAVRAGEDLKLQAHFGLNSGRSVELYMMPGTARTQNLNLLLSSEGTLEGVVRDYITGEAVVGASVRVLGTTSSTLTDLTGRFTMDDLPPGRHLVTTDHLAFEEHTDSVTVFSEEIVDIEIRMATEALAVEGLVVTARTRFGRTSLAGDDKRVDFIGREEIDLLLPRVTDVAGIIRNMNSPGIRVRDVYYADPITGVQLPGVCVELTRRQGGEGCRPAAVALNNIIVLGGADLLRDLDPTTIDRIEILTPIDGSFQFGSAGGNGVVLIFTR